MQDNDPADEVFALLRPHLKYLNPTDRLDPCQDLPSAGLDSMETIDLLLEIEDHFGITVPEERLVEETFSTPGALWRTIRELKSAK